MKFASMDFSIGCRERERDTIICIIINHNVLGLNTAGVAGDNAEGEALLPQR